MVNSTRKRSRTNALDRDESICEALCRWFDASHRKLPFREGKDAYGTWVSEMMLQQTQVKTVIPYFERWMQLFPNVTALANAPESAILSAWQGLGYYSRARNLHRTAKILVEEYDARLPSEPSQLVLLPGIGRYTAGAISSIAYDRAEPVVDGNVIRVLTRLDALHGDPRKKPLDEALWARAKTLVLRSDPSRFNQGLMELGALICTPKNPACSQCPLLPHCRAYPAGLIETLPELPQRKKVEVRHVVVLYVRRGNQVLLRQQPDDSAHWTKLYVMPFAETQSSTPAALLKSARSLACAIDPKAKLSTNVPLLTLRYPITRFRFTASVFALERLTRPSRYGTYIAIANLDRFAVPAPHRKLLERLLPR